MGQQCKFNPFLKLFQSILPKLLCYIILQLKKDKNGRWRVYNSGLIKSFYNSGLIENRFQMFLYKHSFSEGTLKI